ncbi:glycosyl hydrolase [Glaciihabitans sp. dw_435]|uniref:glycosyl hydrolase n=1 Tax=Glaciihabitans sp. dw_435 TaxID=2720081 RepID=UPI001BD658FB|nr:glycosyl hydrolase [Glaciihabitans sp. dw_435]
MSKPNRTWWAPTAANARRTAIGATAIGLCLALASFYVWNSPGSPLAPAAQLTSASQKTALENHLEAKKANLEADVKALETKLANREAALKDATGKSASADATIQDLRDQVAAAQGAADAAASARDKTAAELASKGSGDNGSSAPQSQPAPVTTSKPTTKPTSKPTTKPTGKPTSTPKPPATSTPITAPSLASLINPTSKLFGMYTQQAPFNFATFDDTATKVGETPNVVGYFGGWDEAFRPAAVQAAWKRDTMPVLTWESRPIGSGNDKIVEPGYELPTILSGAFDTYLHQYAKDIVATGLPMGIRFDHEMNGIWYPWAESDGSGKSLNGNNPGDYVKVWKYVHDIFEQEGANKLVAWIWAPNIVNNLPKTHKTAEYLASLYPGDDYVDWVGLSGYLRPPYVDNPYTFDFTFGSSLTQLRALTKKPIFLAEIGASETGGHKAKWITSLFDGLAKPENSDIIGFSWFNLAVTSYVEGVRATNDWRIDSRSDTLAAFVAGITTPGNGYDLTPIAKP